MIRRLMTATAVFVALAGFAPGPYAASNQVTITCWGWPYVLECLKENMGDFSRAHPDIQVEFTQMAPSDIYQKIAAGVSSAVQMPDVVALEDSHLAESIFTGNLLDITARASAYKEYFNSYKWVNCMDQDKIFALPWDSGPVALFYRRDIFARAGLAQNPADVAGLLDTWDDFLKAAATIKEKTGAYMFPLSGASNDGRLFEILLQQQGLGYIDQHGKVVLNSKQAVKTLEFLGKAYKEGLTCEGEQWTEEWMNAIRDGRVATVIGPASLNGYLKQLIAPQTGGDWGVIPLPAWKADEGARTSNDGGSCLAVTKRSQNADAAWTFISFMLARPESQVKMMKAYDCFPALADAYRDPFFDEPDPFYGGQAVGRVFTGLAGEIPPWHYTIDYGRMNNLCSAEIQAYLAGSKDADEALADAAKNIREQTHRK